MDDWQVSFFEACSDASAVAALAVVGDGAFSPGPAVWVGRREVAHFDHDRVVDIRLTKPEIRTRRAELENDPRTTLRPSPSDWIEFAITSDEDIDAATRLVRAAIVANEATAPPGSPPTGGDLDRRRRWH